MDSLPKDPAILLSFVNTELRDNYGDLTEFCCVYKVDINILSARLRETGYVYDERRNQFT